MSLRSSPRAFVRVAALALVPAAIVLAGAGPAAASTKQESIIQDDRLFANSDPAFQTEAFNTADALGADTVHTLLTWAAIAPDRFEKKKPAGFDGADPGDYEPEKWDRWDNLMREAKRTGIDVLASPTGPIPRWAGGCAPKKDPNFPYVCKPSPKEYQAFVTAVSKRYSGTYRDENQGGGVLPKVDRYSIWNEPNEPGWIQPATTGTNAKIYRDLVYAGLAGFKKGGAKRAEILLGETAPLKNSLVFWQNLLCVDSKGKLLKGKTAKKAGCKSGKKPKAFTGIDGVAHHPYDRGGSPPFKKPKKNDINLVGLDKLDVVLAAGAKNKTIKRNIPVYNTEFGVASKPDSTKFGVSYKAQAEAINRAEFIGYNRKNMRSYAQYQLDNDTILWTSATSGRGIFQTGLRLPNPRNLLDRKEKDPTFDAYRMPLYVTGTAGNARVWGGVRPGAKKKVAIQVGKGSSFKTVKTVTVNKYGYIDQKKIKVGKGKLVRLEWKDGSDTFHSRDATVRKN